MGKIKRLKIERAKEREKDTTKEIQRETILPLQVLSQEDYLTAIVLSTLTFVVYAFTAAPGVTLADSGDFLMGVLTLGIVHPPGYPLYTVLGHLFSFLPFGEPAFLVNVFSALWGSLCLGLVFLILRTLSIDRTHAVFATLFLGFTTVFWSKTATAQVYSFNGFLIACIVFWILSYNRDKKNSQLYLIFLATGLALSNHYPLVILTGLGLVFLLDRRDLQVGDYLRGFMFLVLGLTPYLYLFIQASNPDLQYNFGKLSDFGMVLDHIARKSYVNEYGGTVWDKFILAFTFLKSIITNFLLASVFLVIGITCSLVEQWKYRYPLLIAALSPSLGVILMVTFPSNDDFKALLLDYFVPAFLFLSVFLALGLSKLMNRYVKNTIAQVALLLILLLTQVAFNFGTSSHHNDRLAELWGTGLLNSLEPNSIVILGGRTGEKFSLYYLYLVSGLRQDLTLYDDTSAITKDNLYGPGLLFKRRDGIEYRKRRQQELLNNSGRPVYYLSKHPVDEQGVKFSFTPFVIRADKRHFEATNFTKFKLSDGLLHSLGNGYPKSEYWSEDLRRKIVNRLLSYYGGHDLPEVKRIVDSFMQTGLYSDPKFILLLANNLHYFKQYGLSRQLYERAGELSLEAFNSRDRALYCGILRSGKKYEKALPICIDQEQS